MRCLMEHSSITSTQIGKITQTTTSASFKTVMNIRRYIGAYGYYVLAATRGAMGFAARVHR